MLLRDDVNRLKKDRPNPPVVSAVNVLLLAVSTISVLILNAKVNWASFSIWIFWLFSVFVIYWLYTLYRYLAANKLWLQKAAKKLDTHLDSDDYSDVGKAYIAAPLFSEEGGHVDRRLIHKIAEHSTDPSALNRTLSRWLEYKAYLSLVAAVEAMSKARTAMKKTPCHILDKKLEALFTHVFGDDHTGTLASQIGKLLRAADLLLEPDVRGIHAVSTPVGVGLVAAIVPLKDDGFDDFADTGAGEDTVPADPDYGPATARD